MMETTEGCTMGRGTFTHRDTLSKGKIEGEGENEASETSGPN